MKNVKKAVALSLVLIMAVMLVACTKDISDEIRTHFENNRYFYEEYANSKSSKNSTITFTTEKRSLVLTTTIAISIKEGQLDTYRKVLETGVEDSHTEYAELLDRLQTDVPEASFIVRFVDQSHKVIVEKVYK